MSSPNENRGDRLSWVTDVTTLHGDWTGLLSFVSAVLLFTFILLFLPSSSVSLSNIYLAVTMRGCLGKHSCMSSPFPIAILNGTYSLRALILFCGDVPGIKAKLNNIQCRKTFSVGQQTEQSLWGKNLRKWSTCRLKMTSLWGNLLES